MVDFSPSSESLYLIAIILSDEFMYRAKTNIINLRRTSSCATLCRFLSQNAVPVDRKFTLDTDDKVYLYFDGEEIKGSSQFGSWKTSVTVDLPGTTKVIAVKGMNTYGDPGFLGSTSDGYIVTNSSWRCTKDYFLGWNRVEYEYYNWPEAYEVMEYSEKKVSGINPNAKWIWTHSDFRTGKGDRVVFCRFNV